MKMLLLAFIVLVAQFNVLACTKTLKMGTNETNWAPYLIKQGNAFVGAEVDTVNAVFKNSPFCIEWVYFPSLSRVQQELKTGHIDITFAASYTKERAEYSYFTDVYRDEVMLLYKHENAKDVINLAALFERGFIVGVNRGSFFGAEFEKIRKHYPNQIVLTADANTRFGMLNKRRVDYVIDDSVVAKYFAKRYSTILPVKTAPAINVNGVHFMMSKQSVTLDEVAVINGLIKNNKAAIERIYKSY
ncbi:MULTISPECIES: substrate-binding periplasmic protein [Pseudoalteromonas]|uniref:substrate-binding periplasmic protein n=1 Tax=Pseudoalteromonas TaxID=53246 RepID=UPI00249A696A|nr:MULTISPECIES: transporter substrate-binding domain-containing protein [Pseudoalteromonas]MDI3247027.1 transporter substrate-binding domain-containing protein [Pseudoalteromonas agarivorans]WRU74868.1 transporter substrate-binding domain-containing protein [Pseudoalteromonas sp. CuT 4-3]